MKVKTFKYGIADIPMIDVDAQAKEFIKENNLLLLDTQLIVAGNRLLYHIKYKKIDKDFDYCDDED